MCCAVEEVDFVKESRRRQKEEEQKVQECKCKDVIFSILLYRSFHRRGRRSKTPTPDYSKEEVEEKNKCKENKSWWRKLLELLGRKPKS